MYTFRKTHHPRSVMFAVSYDDGRTAYFVIENHDKASGDAIAGSLAREHQAQGQLPEGTITAVRRVR
jgi:hypothetical protein